MSEMLVSKIIELEKRERRNRAGKNVGLATGIYDTSNVSNPPTDAELDTIYGMPSDFPAGAYVGMVNDNGLMLMCGLCIRQGVTGGMWGWRKLYKSKPATHVRSESKLTLARLSSR